jgi:hypothetical protein
MHRVGIEPTIPVFERAKTVHALDRAATVIGLCTPRTHIFGESSRNPLLTHETSASHSGTSFHIHAGNCTCLSHMGKKLQIIYLGRGGGGGKEAQGDKNIVTNKLFVAVYKSKVRARVNGARISLLSHAPQLVRRLYYRQQNCTDNLEGAGCSGQVLVWRGYKGPQPRIA